MNKQTTDTLARFCIAQSDTFNPNDWFYLNDIDEKAVALAAKYLSMTSWYGHEDSLEKIAEKMHPFIQNSTGLHIESRLIDFDLPYFSSIVRMGIAKSRILTHSYIAFVSTKRRSSDITLAASNVG